MGCLVFDLMDPVGVVVIVVNWNEILAITVYMRIYDLSCFSFLYKWCFKKLIKITADSLGGLYLRDWHCVVFKLNFVCFLLSRLKRTTFPQLCPHFTGNMRHLQHMCWWFRNRAKQLLCLVVLSYKLRWWLVFKYMNVWWFHRFLNHQQMESQHNSQLTNSVRPKLCQ